MTQISHLTEEQRQMLADGTISGSRIQSLDAHLRACDACAADVEQLRRLIARVSAPSGISAPPDDLWPSIRSRIEHTKIVPLAGADGGRPQGSRHALRPWILGAAAAAIVSIAVLAALNSMHRRGIDSPVPAATRAELTAVNDSVRSYETEARDLLDRLELERAMIRPDAMAPIDRDLAVIDRAIGELRVAIAEDPNNPALRRLLAASYRQKVDILRRANNAG